jgi:Flp pilus assembly protein TadB
LECGDFVTALNPCDLLRQTLRRFPLPRRSGATSRRTPKNLAQARTGKRRAVADFRYKSLRSRIFDDKDEPPQENISMNSQTLGLRVAGVVFAIFALGHLLRLIKQTEVLVAGNQIPMWVSVVALIVAGGLSLWLWRLSSNPRT